MRERLLGVERFTVDVPQAALEDLAERLARTRWPGDLDGPATCGSSQPWVTVDDRPCLCSTVVTRTQRGPRVAGPVQLGSHPSGFSVVSTVMPRRSSYDRFCVRDPGTVVAPCGRRGVCPVS
jgi:hypothetical protein